jgi:uncharacterized protein YnzC (UPF0291/DUF896 family)
MKLNNIVSQAFQASFSKLMKQEKIPVKTAFKLRGVAKAVREECAKYEELRKQYIETYSMKDKKGNQLTDTVNNQTGIKLRPDKVKEFNEKMVELGNIEVEIPQIRAEELGNEEHLNLTPEDIFLLEFIVE